MDPVNWSKQFPVVCINKADLTEFGFTEEQIITQFSDEVMRQIADEMQSCYHLQQPFWKDFEKAVKTVLALEVQAQRMHSIDPTKKFEVLTISRMQLETMGIPHDQVAHLSDEDMARIARALAKTYPDFEDRVRINVRAYLLK